MLLVQPLVGRGVIALLLYHQVVPRELHRSQILVTVSPSALVHDGHWIAELFSECWPLYRHTVPNVSGIRSQQSLGTA